MLPHLRPAAVCETQGQLGKRNPKSQVKNPNGEFPQDETLARQDQGFVAEIVRCRLQGIDPSSQSTKQCSVGQADAGDFLSAGADDQAVGHQHGSVEIGLAVVAVVEPDASLAD